MENKVDFLESDGVQIALFFDGQTKGEHSAYYPKNILFFVKQGKLHLRFEEELNTVSKNEFCLVRKFTTGQYFKSWTKKEGGAIVYAFIFQDDLVATAVSDFKYAPPQKRIEDRIIYISSNKILRGLFDNMLSYLAEKEDLEKQLVTLKTKEAIWGIFKSNPDYLSAFSQFYQTERADLEVFMHHHYHLNLTLEKLARLSGRSLSDFNRTFKKLFQQSPHRWIMQQRLNKAKEILVSTNRKPTEFYMELGFMDLAHFSRSFKKAFGKTPTEIRNAVK